MSTKSQEIDTYIEAQSADVQQKLHEIRAIIHECVPDATELINYAIPAFSLVKGGKREEQLMMAGFAKHVGFYPHLLTIEAFEEKLKSYKYAKGSIQFPLKEPLPKELITEMVKYRYEQLQNQKG